jgi:hypothetical protein
MWDAELHRLTGTVLLAENKPEPAHHRHLAHLERSNASFFYSIKK